MHVAEYVPDLIVLEAQVQTLLADQADDVGITWALLPRWGAPKRWWRLHRTSLAAWLSALGERR